jgi:hypothetical protein
LSGTSYDGIHLVYLDKMGGMATLMLKIFMMFSILSLAFLAHERFFWEINGIFWNNYCQKICFNAKHTNYFCNDINSIEIKPQLP